MRRCEACRIDVEGNWARCPLCSAPLAGGSVPSPFPAVPLSFSRRRVLKVLFLSSLAVIVLSLAAQLLFSRDRADIGVFRSIWLGVSAMWLVVLMAARKRRNLAKGTAYLVVIVSLVCVYWDYLTGWHGWALTFAVPAICACSVVALLITVWVMRIETGEHIVYSGLTVLLGLVPILFLVLGWVDTAWPSVACVALSAVTITALQVAGGHVARHELAKRLHL
ncbi:DUF6320 domain-containing protein [Gulosibacter sp. 10]|uniref:DUF6320 domain-containing protein n=1 Tax=Gulosibacter sp. 10 TaxID=1255570 RepID=UPI00097EE917|nr:DUF6320 domain-containing protein [Gulosibacter sp. 10]SJM65082.1 hypothetical protein FM112_10620 [Gulosibacter sp. 10]